MLDLQNVSFDEHHHRLLESVTLHAQEGELTFFTAAAPLGRTALSLITSARMVPDEGQALLDGTSQPKRLRRSAALVDSPGITAPEHHMRVHDVVAETLGLTPRRGIRTRGTDGARPTPRTWLRTLGAEDLAAEHIDALSPEVRIWLLIELGFADPCVRLAVLDSPDRHGLPTEELAALLRDLASPEERTLIAVIQDPALQSPPPEASGQEQPS